MNETYTLITPIKPQVPIIISSPHSGTEIPKKILDYMSPKAASSTDSDTLIHELYAFAASMGITQIYSRFSRYVIDLNRPQNKASLYSDGRSETALIPTKTFAGDALYDNHKITSDEEEFRIENFYKPYHEQLSQLIDEAMKEFGRVLLFEAHSITRYVPTINKDKFPDLIIGTLDGQTCHNSIENSALSILRSKDFEVSLNAPFKGGFITRNYADAKNGIHTLQLEMCKDIYMDENETKLDSTKADKISRLLKNTFQILSKKVMEL